MKSSTVYVYFGFTVGLLVDVGSHCNVTYSKCAWGSLLSEYAQVHSLVDCCCLLMEGIGSQVSSEWGLFQWCLVHY